MTKKTTIILSVITAVIAVTALSAGIVLAQQDNGTAWNATVTQSDSSPDYDNVLCAGKYNGSCDGECDGSCDGDCNGDCSGSGNCFRSGLNGQSAGECNGGNCSQFAYGNGGKQSGCRGGGCR